MSATGRGAERSPHDAYDTPSWCVKRFLEKCELPPGSWLEPGAGSGCIVRVVNEVIPKWIDWTLVEIREECKEFWNEGDLIVGDFIQEAEKYREAGKMFDVTITNPPYKYAMDFIEAAWPISKYVAFLLRLNFMASQKRCEWMKANKPDIYVLPDRPSFDLLGTDATEYAWFVWKTKHLFGPRKFGKVYILDSTPQVEREM